MVRLLFREGVEVHAQQGEGRGAPASRTPTLTLSPEYRGEGTEMAVLYARSRP